jgi:hypothetical protein
VGKRKPRMPRYECKIMNWNSIVPSKVVWSRASGVPSSLLFLFVAIATLRFAIASRVSSTTTHLE